MGIIYKHTSPSGKSYIGQTKYDSWEKRAGKDLFSSYGNCKKFYNAILKYGWENFRHEIVENSLDDTQERLTREQYWINEFDSIENGYNLRVSEGIEINPQLYRISEEGSIEAIDLYNRGLSLAEVGKKLGVHFSVVYGVLKANKVEMRGRGTNPSTFVKMDRTKVCLVCDSSFTSSKARDRYCSKICAGIAGSSSYSGISLEEGLEKYTNPNCSESEYTFPEEMTNTQRGGVVSSHNRWHKGVGKSNPNCLCCQQDSDILVMALGG